MKLYAVICNGKLDGHIIPIPEACSKYYYCLDGIAYLDDCIYFGYNYIFDHKIQDCTYSEKLDCDDRSLSIPEVYPSVPKQISSTFLQDDVICKKHENGKNVGLKGSCSRFYRCHNGIGILDDCLNFGANYFFDPSTGDCNNFGHQIACIYDTFIPSTPQKPLIRRLGNERVKISPPDYDTELCIGYQDGEMFGIEGSCSKYYYCVDEIGYLDSCKMFGDYQFDVNINDCYFKSKVMCDETKDVFK